MENKIATTEEQSKKLLELGIDEGTADMYWWHYDEKTYLSGMFDGEFNKREEDVPAWSLSALMELLPSAVHTEIGDILELEIVKTEFGTYLLQYANAYNGKVEITSGFQQYPTDAVFDVVVKLNENKLI